MAVILIATAGGATANSYATLAEADQYHSERIYSEKWTSATTLVKEQALIEATEILDALVWRGNIASETQALSWPRNNTRDHNGRQINSGLIPTFLVKAASIMALDVITEDRDADPDSAGLAAVKIGSISLDFTENERTTQVVSRSVTKLISHYLLSGGGNRIIRA